jgi:hypothetical protein
MGHALELCPLACLDGWQMGWAVGSFLGTCSEGKILCPDGLGKKLHFQRVSGQHTNVFEQASIEIAGSEF